MTISTTSLVRSQRREVRFAAVLGMSQETRDAWALLGRRLATGPLTLLGAPGPNRVLLDRARRDGALEGGLDDARAPTRTVVIPLTGATPSQRRRWKAGGHELLDLTLPSIRRAHVTFSLMAAEGCRLVLAGFRGDPEAAAITGDLEQVAIVENADEAAALPFAPATALVCQTGISRQRVQAIAGALNSRHRDGRLQIFDTLSPAHLARERALVELGRWADLILIVADPADASGRALYESARWLGRPARILSSVRELEEHELSGARRVGLSAGEFTPADLVAAVAVRAGGG